MKNYISRIPLGDGKFAFHQAEGFRIAGEELANAILRNWDAPKIFYHMRNGGHVAALKKHTNSIQFTHLDISRFFYRISKNKIIRALQKTGFSFLEANEAASHSVVKQGAETFLPYGFVQSPILASLCLFHSGAGKHLMRAPKSLVVSVYVDDIVISCRSIEEKALLEDFSQQTLEKFDECGLPISSKKMVICEPEITSFNVHLKHKVMEISEERMNAFVHQVSENRENPDSLRGISSYVHSINADQGKIIDDEIARVAKV